MIRERAKRTSGAAIVLAAVVAGPGRLGDGPRDPSRVGERSETERGPDGPHRQKPSLGESLKNFFYFLIKRKSSFVSFLLKKRK